MGQPLHLLIVEDSPTDTELVVRALREGGYDLRYKRVDRASDFKKALEEDHWDLIISDYRMPHFSEPLALEILKKSKQDIPFIVVSGKIGEEIAIEAMRAGACDYIMKDNLTRLTPAVSREIQDAKERARRRQTEWELEYFIAMLTHDLKTPIQAELRVFEQLEGGSFGLLNPKQYEIVKDLIQANHLVQHMVNNILTAYKYRQHKVHLRPELTELGYFISQLAESSLIQTMLQDKELQLVVEPTETVPVVNIDRNEIQRVLLNLIKNATDYSPQGESIRVSIEWRRDFVRIAVKDKGPCVNPQIEPYLFTPYAAVVAKKLRKLGLGLGLYLSKEIVEAHGGKIGYQKYMDEGCEFHFDLPVPKNPPIALFHEPMEQ